MKGLVILFALFALTFANYVATPQSFDMWRAKYQVNYETQAEYNHRYMVWTANLAFINGHDESKGYTVEMNKFGDLTAKEFASIYNGVNITKTPMSENTPTPNIPTNVDWRTKGAVTGVKNQGQCGSCWSFSTTGSVEGVHKISTGNLVSLSEQNLVDCSTAEGNMGCNGGLMDDAFKYIISNNGIDTESSYPYTATGPNVCKFSRSNVGATISSYHDIPSGDEGALAQAIVDRPVSVAIDASHSSFQFYSGGIYYEPACSSYQLDHGVLAIGYGDGFYWVKNSWGTGWGLSGYIKMSRGRNNNCGIATSASYPIA